MHLSRVYSVVDYKSIRAVLYSISATRYNKEQQNKNKFIYALVLLMICVTIMNKLSR